MSKNVHNQAELSENALPTKSPDLTPTDLFLWCLLKVKVYKNHFTIEQLEDAY